MRAKKKQGAPSVQKSPHPHRMVGRVEVTAWPDGVVGVAIPDTVVNFLLSPYLAFQLAAAITEMASKASEPKAPRLADLQLDGLRERHKRCRISGDCLMHNTEPKAPSGGKAHD